MAEYTFRSRLEKLKKYYSDLPEQLSQISEKCYYARRGEGCRANATD